MRRGLISIFIAVVWLGLAAGCSGDGGLPTAASPSSSRSGGASPSRDRPEPSRSISPRERDSVPASHSGPAAPSSSKATATKTVESTDAASPAPAGGTSSGASGDTSAPLWPWILLAVVVVALVVWVVGSARRRSRAERDWGARVTDACAQGAALQDAIVVAEMSGLETNADGRWADIQRRADGLNQALHSLWATAPTEEARLGVNDTLTALQAVQLAITPQRAPDAVDRAQTAGTQERLRALDNALRALRAGGGR